MVTSEPGPGEGTEASGAAEPGRPSWTPPASAASLARRRSSSTASGTMALTTSIRSRLPCERPGPVP